MIKNTCLACGQYDDHPKDQVILPDHSSVFYHMDCHSRTDAGCRGCYASTETAGGKTGDALRAHLHSPELKEHLATNYPDLTVVTPAAPVATTKGGK